MTRWLTILMLLLSTGGCAVFADRQRAPAMPPAVASTTDQPPQAVSASQLASVEVSWEDRAGLQSPATEARLLSEAVMDALRQRGMVHPQADRSLRVRVMEVLLRPGGQMKTGTSVLNTRVYVLAADGSEDWNFPLRTAQTVTARSSLTAQQQMAELYQRYAAQLADALQQRSGR